MSEELNKCRESGGALIVSYALDDDEYETENLTHRDSIGCDEIEERGDDEFSYVIEFGESVEHAFVTTMGLEGLHLTQQRLTLQTLEQLADMFTRAANTLRERQQEAEAKTDRQFNDVSVTNQQTLPMEEQN